MQEHYDSDVKEITELVKKTHVETNIPKIVTYYSSGGENNFFYINLPVKIKMTVLDSLRRYLMIHNDIILVIKPHPGETNKTLFNKEYHDFFNLPNVIILDVDKAISAYSLLQYSHLNISDISTMGPHSKYFGFNTIVANLLNIDILFEKEGRKNNCNYYYVTTEEEFFSAMDALTAKEGHWGKRKNNRADAFIDEVSQLIVKNLIEDKRTSGHNFTLAKI
jgi:hypothetical protein